MKIEELFEQVKMLLPIEKYGAINVQVSMWSYRPDIDNDDVTDISVWSSKMQTKICAELKCAGEVCPAIEVFLEKERRKKEGPRPSGLEV